MASAEVDIKYVGYHGKITAATNPFLSSFLFKVLGLSVMLSEKLLRARRSKTVDPIRDPAARKLVHNILWLGREGLVMVEQYILPMVGNYVELRVLAYKLRASFYHIFVLFHNDPPVNRRTPSGSATTYSLFPDPLSPRGTRTTPPRQMTPGRSSSGASYTIGGPVSGPGQPPPGLPLPNVPKPGASAVYLLPLLDYTPTATDCFREADALAESLLPGSHPIRLSVKVEYVAYMYDCLRASEESRRWAKKAIRDVYEATEGMDDESFEDAAEMVGVLGRMMKRGLGGVGGSSGGSGSGGVATAAAASAAQQPRRSPSARDQGRGSPREKAAPSRGSGLRGGDGSKHHRSQSTQQSHQQPQQRPSESRRRGSEKGTGSGNGHSSHHHSGESRKPSRRHHHSTSSAPTSWV